MEPANSAPAPTPGSPATKEDPTRRFPPEARAAYQQFRETGDVSVLDPVLFAILDDFTPVKTDRVWANVAGESRLIEDLGFDSLAMTEVVFFTEELFGITISNEEILQVRTLDDLRRFVRTKLATPKSS